jgi:hypothetical protein
MPLKARVAVKIRPKLQLEQAGIGTRRKKVDNHFLNCPLNRPPEKQKARFQTGNGLFSRGGGIRTPGPVTVSGFQDRRNRPLCHSSGSGCYA